MMDQQDCVLNDLEELGGKEFLLKHQHNTESFLVSSSSCHAALPLIIRPMLRIQSLHHLLEVESHDEEDWSVSLTLKSQRVNILVVQYQSKFFPDGYSSCRWGNRSTSLWFCFGLRSARKSKYIRFQRKVLELHLGGFLIVVVLLLVVQGCDQLDQAMRNPDPRSVAAESSWIVSSELTHVAGPVWIRSGAFRLLAECIHVRPLHEIVRILQCLSSWNTVRFQQQSEFLHPYKICSLCLVVITFQFVLYIVAIDLLVVQDHQSKVCLSSSHLERTMGWIVLPQQVSLVCHGRIRIHHTFLRLLRKDWADLQK